jgi:Uma2 family endonuclease
VPTAFRFTSKDLDAMPRMEGVRYEIIDGELHVSNAPHWHHQYAADEILIALRTSREVSATGVTVTAPGLVFAEDQDVIPDLVWISNERLARGQDATGHFTIAPELIVEVLSTGWSNEHRDRDVKLSLYSRQGVDECWIGGRGHPHYTAAAQIRLSGLLAVGAVDSWLLTSGQVRSRRGPASATES